MRMPVPASRLLGSSTGKPRRMARYCARIGVLVSALAACGHTLPMLADHAFSLLRAGAFGVKWGGSPPPECSGRKEQRLFFDGRANGFLTARYSGKPGLSGSPLRPPVPSQPLPIRELTGANRTGLAKLCRFGGSQFPGEVHQERPIRLRDLTYHAL
jgi:hypothetical protein